MAQADLSLYSSGLNLLALGIRMARYKTIVIDAVIMLSMVIYVLFVRQNFLGPFESFLSLIGVALAAWEAVFLVGWKRWRVNMDQRPSQTRRSPLVDQRVAAARSPYNPI